MKGCRWIVRVGGSCRCGDNIRLCDGRLRGRNVMVRPIWSLAPDNWEYLTRDSRSPGSNPCLVLRYFYWTVTSGMSLLDNLQMPLAIMQFQYYKWFIFQACRTLQSTLSYWTKGRCFLSGSTRRNSVRSWTITKSSCWLVKQAVAKQHRYYIQW